jgi:AraC-like DNA-binding protein
MQPASTLRPVLDYVDRAGLPRSPRMERIAARLGDPSLLMPSALAGVFLDEVRRAGGGEDVGLRIGEQSRIEQIGAFGHRLRCVPTLAAALDLAVRQRHNSAQRFVVSRRGAEVWLQRSVSASLQRARLQEHDLSLMLTIRFFRLAAGPGWRPSEIHFEGPAPAHAEQLATLAERSVCFGGSQTVIVFPAAILARPLPRSKPAASTGSPPSIVAPTELAGSLRAMVRSLIQIGELTLATAAETAGTSTRSLQRHLAAADLQFADVVDDVRFEMACASLREPHAKVGEIAVELGYTDSANFTRAFRRWAGVPPRAFQRAVSEPALAS